MTATTPRPSKKPPQSKKPQRGINASLQRQRRSRVFWIAGAIVAVVAIAAVAAIIAGSGGDDGDSSLEQIQPVEISGTPLPVYDRTATVDPAIGIAAPQVNGLTFDSTKTSIQPGKPTMLVFLAHWCPHCQAEVPRLVQWYQAGHAPAGLDVIGIATSTDPNQSNYPPSSWLEREEWPSPVWPVLVDDGASSTFSTFGFETYPAFVILDADGTVKFRGTGEIETVELDRILESTLGLT